MIIFSDLHLREETAETVFGEVLPGIYEAAKQHLDKEIVCLGDVFHVRFKVDGRLQNALKDEFKRWVDAGLSLRILPGNHDQYNVDGRNVLEVFDEINHVEVYSSPREDSDGFWIPYRKNIDEVKQAVQYANTNWQGKKVLFMHHGVRGAWMNDGYQNKDGIELETFGGWHTILCGHYHKRQTVGLNLHYLGSPYQTKADEARQPKGYSLWDGEKLTFVETHWGSKYHIIEIGEDQTLDLSQVQPRDEVRVTVKGKGSELRVASLAKQLRDLGIERHTVTPEIEQTEARLDVRPQASVDEYAKAYVDAMDTSLNREMLMNIYTELRAP